MPSPCSCTLEHAPKLVVVTGGPGAGKTAVLEVAQRLLCRHVVVLPEAASILWRGQFPRHATVAGRKAAQRAIVRLQLEMQRMTIEEGHAAMILCDRGTLDGLAYWPGSEAEYFDDTATTKDRELARYATVIHLQPPGLEHGYLATQVRIETAAEAAVIDARIAQAWSGHPRRFVVASDDDFVAKLHRAIDLIRAEVPACCRTRAS
jgi:predicted ATPase